MRLLGALRRLPAPVTAERLAAETEISRRQLYRDIATLRAGGALIDGAAGYGYTLTEDPALPPQSFSRLETEALMLAVGSLDQLGDQRLAGAGRDAMARIIATLPDRQARQSLHAIMRSWRPDERRAAIAVDIDLLREACWEETSVIFAYCDKQSARSEREVLPLGLSYSPSTLMLVGWCLLRGDYRTFEVARMKRRAKFSPAPCRTAAPLYNFAHGGMAPERCSGGLRPPPPAIPIAGSPHCPLRAGCGCRRRGWPSARPVR